MESLFTLYLIRKMKMELVVLKKVKKGFIEKKTLKRLKGGLNKRINFMKSLCKCILTL